MRKIGKWKMENGKFQSRVSPIPHWLLQDWAGFHANLVVTPQQPQRRRAQPHVLNGVPGWVWST
jgi:hypothetical protein